MQSLAVYKVTVYNHAVVTSSIITNRVILYLVTYILSIFEYPSIMNIIQIVDSTCKIQMTICCQSLPIVIVRSHTCSEQRTILCGLVSLEVSRSILFSRHLLRNVDSKLVDELGYA